MMTRREVLGGVAALAGFGAARADAADWLAETPLINHQARPIRRVVEQATSADMTDREKAVALFRFVRDEIEFGFAAGFWNQSASEVLTSGRGFCNTMSTLFVAFLRAAGVPARQVFVEIDRAVLHGLIDPGTPFLDHSYTEVLIDGAWIGTDAYIVDPPLFAPAKARTRAEGRVFGYGVHAEGENDWDGARPTFSQYNLNAASPLRGRRWGVYADVADFYARADGAHNRLNAFARVAFGALAGSANARAEALRSA